MAPSAHLSLVPLTEFTGIEAMGKRAPRPEWFALAPKLLGDPVPSLPLPSGPLTSSLPRSQPQSLPRARWKDIPRRGQPCLLPAMSLRAGAAPRRSVVELSRGPPLGDWQPPLEPGVRLTKPGFTSPDSSHGAQAHVASCAQGLGVMHSGWPSSLTGLHLGRGGSRVSESEPQLWLPLRPRMSGAIALQAQVTLPHRRLALACSQTGGSRRALPAPL